MSQPTERILVVMEDGGSSSVKKFMDLARGTYSKEPTEPQRGRPLGKQRRLAGLGSNFFPKQKRRAKEKRK